MKHGYLVLLAAVIALATLGAPGAVARQFTASPPKLIAYVSNFDGNSVEIFNLSSGVFLGHLIDPGSGGLRNPHRMIIGPDGLLYIGTGDAVNEVKRYNPITGDFVDTLVSNGSGGLWNATGERFGPDGELYVSSAWTSDIKRYSHMDGSYLGSFISGNGLNVPGYFEFRPDGMVYVISSGITSGTAAIKRFNSKTGAYVDDFVTANSGGLSKPDTFKSGPDGNLYVSSWGSDEVIRYNGTTGAYIDKFIKSGSGGLQGPGSIVFAPDGYFYVSSGNSGRVKRYNSKTGAFISDLDPMGQAQMTHPGDIFLRAAPNGTLDRVAVRSNPVSAHTNTVAYVYLSSPAKAPATVSARMDNDNIVSVLGSPITIPAGSSKATFLLAAGNVKTDSSCQLIVSDVAEGTPLTITTPLNVNAVYLGSLSINPNLISVGAACKGTVTLTEPAVTPVRLAIGLSGAHSNSVKLEDTNGNPISTLTIPVGKTTADFKVDTTGVTSPVSVMVVANYAGTAKSASLKVFPNGTLASVVVAPNPISGGANATGTVTLAAPASVPVTVSVRSSNSNVATISGTPLIIRAGDTTGIFTVVAKPVKTASSCNIIVSDNTPSTQQTVVHVNP